MRDLNRSSTLSVRRPSGSTQAADTEPAAAPAQPTATHNGERALRSDALLQGRSHVNIMHNGETYQLRATRLGKLILTK
jgi:hemin uptake protein HemP